MSARTPIVSALLILGASALSLWQDLRNQSLYERKMSDWTQAHRSYSARASTNPTQNIYWRWRALPDKNRLDYLSKGDAWAVFSAGPGQEVWAINAAAEKNINEIPTKVMPLISVSTASFLGVEIEEEPEIFRILGEQIIGSLNPWREALAQRCGDCAPPPASFRAPAEPLHAGSQGLDPRGTTGISIAVERYRRTVLPIIARPSPMAAMVKRIREGGAPTAREWSTPGLAGMAALEIGARGEVKWIPALLQAAKTGPSGTDQIAAMWAARHLGSQDPIIQRVEAAL